MHLQVIYRLPVEHIFTNEASVRLFLLSFLVALMFRYLIFDYFFKGIACLAAVKKAVFMVDSKEGVDVKTGGLNIYTFLPPQLSVKFSKPCLLRIRTQRCDLFTLVGKRK